MVEESHEPAAHGYWQKEAMGPSRGFLAPVLRAKLGSFTATTRSKGVLRSDRRGPFRRGRRRTSLRARLWKAADRRFEGAAGGW